MPDLTLSPLNFVNVGPDGTFRKSGDVHSTPQDVDNLIAHLNQTNKPMHRVVLYFHGGLVSERSGMDRAANIAQVFADTPCHPVTFVWETDFINTIQERLKSIGQTSLFKKLLEFVVKVAGERLGVEANAKGARKLSSAEIQAQLTEDEPFAHLGGTGAKDASVAGLTTKPDEILKQEIQVGLEEEVAADMSLKAILTEEAPQTPLLDKDKITDTLQGGKKGFFSTAKLVKTLVTVGFKVVKRHVNKSDHGFLATVVEELLRELYLADFGAWVWGGMKQKAQAMWETNEGRQGEDLHAGAYLLKGLSEWKAQAPESRTIDLIGHSAGAIAICHLLRVAATRHPDLLIRNIVFMAPACTVNDFVEHIVGRTNRFNQFRMFTMLDETERKDHLVPALYNRSLLYFISGVLEGSAGVPIAGLQRHIRGQAPYDNGDPLEASAYLLEAGKNRLVLAATAAGAVDGLQCDSLTHGSFGDNPLTQKSLVHILNAV